MLKFSVALLVSMVMLTHGLRLEKMFESQDAKIEELKTEDVQGHPQQQQDQDEATEQDVLEEELEEENDDKPQKGKTPCEDSDKTQCPLWAARGECRKNKKFMKKNCCQSCRCPNDSPNCDEWAKARRCEYDPVAMGMHCRKACNKC